MKQESQVFSYSVSRNESAAVVFFSGILQLESLTQFDLLQQDLLHTDSLKVLLLDFSQLKNITMDAVPNFVNFQQAIRQKKIDLRICSLNESLKEKLSKLGVIRHSEIRASVKSAVQSISQVGQRKAS